MIFILCFVQLDLMVDGGGECVYESDPFNPPLTGREPTLFCPETKITLLIFRSIPHDPRVRSA